ncbi:MAG TPA: hemerythrin domain-containing protein [Thermoanaerobaculia bacterium]
MENSDERRTSRRAFLAGGTLLAGTQLARPKALFAMAAPEESDEEDVTPAEDLMREHGALNRILLIYDEAVTRLESKKDFPPEVLAGVAGIIRRFIEEYHEKLEEDHLFPRFEKAGKLTDLVGVLRQQHEAGRVLTRQIESGATASALRNPSDRGKTVRSLKLFIRMYRPHEAREDTILFPMLRKIINLNDYETLGDQFEAKEHELFGQDGFEGVVGQIAELEKKAGLYDLARFTPPA